MGSSFLNLFGETQLSLQDIADKARQLQQKIDENAEQEKANLRAATEQKHQEIEKHAAELARHANSSIEAYKTAQLQTAERQKAYQQAVVRQQAEQAKRLIDQQAAQAIAAVETRDRQMDLQRQQQDLGGAAGSLGHAAGSPMAVHGLYGGCGASCVPPCACNPGESARSGPGAMLKMGGPVSAADAERMGSLGAAAANWLQGSESYSSSTAGPGLRRMGGSAGPVGGEPIVAPNIPALPGAMPSPFATHADSSSTGMWGGGLCATSGDRTLLQGQSSPMAQVG